MSKNKAKIAAAIDIGSSGVRMHISQWDGRQIVLLDQMEKPTNMGKEVFSTGYISFDTVHHLSTTLEGFCAAAKEYDVAQIYATATTALREAANRAYVLDHLKIRNRLDVHVLEDIEANALLFDAMKISDSFPDENAMLVYGGSGTIDFALLNDGQAVFTHSIRTGLLKISEMLRETADYSINTGLVAEEYMRTFLTRAGRMQDILSAEGIVFGAGNMKTIFELCGSFGTLGTDNIAMLKRKTLLEIYEQYCQLSVSQIAARHKLNDSQGGILFAMLTLLASLLKMTKVKRIFCTQINLTDAALNLILRPDARRTYNESLNTGVISSAMDLSARYGCNLKHSQYVAEHAMLLFGKLRKLHGLSGQRSILLHTACLLHESGDYTNNADSREASYNLVKAAQIYGLTSRETLLAANIIAPQNLLGINMKAHRSTTLKEEEFLFVGKMHALLYLADALDYSRQQKAELSDVEFDGNRITLTMKVRENYALEQWMFRQRGSLFQEVFGIVPFLRVKNEYSMGGKL